MRFRPTIAENLEVILRSISAARGKGAETVLFPECALTGYNLDFFNVAAGEVNRSLDAIARAAGENRCHVLVGTPTFARGERFNSLLVFGKAGQEIFRYSKIHLTPRDARYFSSGNSLAFFRLGPVSSTAIICHERRYPELVRLPVMLGARIIFHPNAGLDALGVSKSKRGGRDGIPIRAFETEVYYLFANSVGPQGDGLWSAGDSKIVGPDGKTLALANNRDEGIICAEIDLSLARRTYARKALVQPEFLRRHWRALLDACKRQVS